MHDFYNRVYNNYCKKIIGFRMISACKRVEIMVWTNRKPIFLEIQSGLYFVINMWVFAHRVVRPKVGVALP